MNITVKIILTILLWGYALLLVRANHIRARYGREDENEDMSPFIRISLTFIIWSL